MEVAPCSRSVSAALARVPQVSGIIGFQGLACVILGAGERVWLAGEGRDLGTGHVID